MTCGGFPEAADVWVTRKLIFSTIYDGVIDVFRTTQRAGLLNADPVLAAASAARGSSNAVLATANPNARRETLVVSAAGSAGPLEDEVLAF